MNLMRKSKKELTEEIFLLRQRLAELETCQTDRDQAQRTVNKINAKLSAIIKSFDGLMYICAQDYRVEYMNAQLIRRTGRDATGELCYNALHDRDAICPWCVNTRVFQGETVRWEVQSPKDGRWYYVVNSPIYNENGTISKQSMMLDITERKKAEQLLHQAHADLERIVEKRTAELLLKNQQLTAEIDEHRRTEHALRQSEAKYRSVVDNIGIGIALISPDMEIMTLNDQMRKWCPNIDPSKHPICYQSFNDPPGSSVCGYCPTYKTLKDGKVHQEITETPAGDQVRNYKIIASPIRDSAGKIVAAIEMVEDITKINRMQQRLKDSENLYRTIFETSASATMIVDEDTTICLVNTEFEKLSGFAKTEIEGKKSWTEFVAPEDRKMMETYHRLRRIDPQAAPRNYEFSVCHRNGQFRHAHTTVAMLPGTSKSVVSLLDITERKQSEAALSQSEAHLRALMDTIPDPLVVYDPSGAVMYINSAFTRVYGWSQEELLGRSIDFVPPTEAEKTREAWERTMRREKFLLETKRSTKRGKLLDIELATAILLDQEDKLKASIVIHRDVTERNKAHLALLESERQLRYFSSRLQCAQEEERKRIARDLHDSIGQALILIKLNAENMLKSIPDGEQTQELAKPLKSLLPSIQDCVEETRRICSGLRPAMLDDIGVIATIGWFCRNFHFSCPDIQIKRSIGVEESEIAEPLKIVIFRILQEALNNITKYSRASQVHISLVKKSGKLELMIKDNGAGFELKAIPIKAGCEGGLGLTGMRERAELSGGRFQMTSAKDKGTTIAVVWPYKE